MLVLEYRNHFSIVDHKSRLVVVHPCSTLFKSEILAQIRTTVAKIQKSL